MRILVACGLLLALIAGWLAIRWLDADAPPPPDLAAVREVPAGGAELPSGTVAAQAQRQAVVASDLAEVPTACLRVVDHATGLPVAGAAVRRVRDGADLAFTDELGLAALPLRGFEQLAVVADGCLLRLAPTRPGSTAAEPQLVRMVVDRWSARVRFDLRGPGAAPVAAALVRFRRQDGTARPPTEVPVPAGDTVLARAWSEHVMLAGRPVGGDVLVEPGDGAPDRVHRFGDGAEVRFVVPGPFVVEAATLSGLVGHQPIVVAAASAAAAQHVRLELGPGMQVAGTVCREADGAPLAGAQVTIAGGDPLGLVATTTADGTFRLGPVAPDPLVLHVRHGDYEPRAVGPVSVPLAGLRIGLQPADGTFQLRTTGSGPARLAIQAPGCLLYAELADPGAAFADYDVLPGTTEARLAAGLSGVLAGAVIDAAGAPQAGVAVRWQPRHPTMPAGVPDRRVLAGGTLDLPLVVTTAADGSFALETHHFGAGRLALGDGGDAPGSSVETEVRPGVTTAGLRLRRQE